MARIGDQIRPELGKTDYSAYMQGAAAGGQSIGKGIAEFASQLNQGLEERKERKDFSKKTDVRMEGLVKLYGEDSEIGKAAQGMRDLYANDDIKGSDKFAAAQGIESFLGDMMEKKGFDLNSELGLGQLGVAQGQLGVAQQQAGYAGRAETRADTKAAREESEYGRLLGEREHKVRALEMWYGSGGDLSGLNLEGEPLALREGIASLEHQYGQIAAKKTGSYGTTELGRTDADGIQWLDKTLTVNGVPQVGQVFGTRPDKQMVLTPTQRGQVAWQEKRLLSSEGRVQEVIASAKTARAALLDIRQAEALLMDPDVYTGRFKDFKQMILGFANVAGIDATALGKMEQLDVLLGNFVMARVAQTRGAISEREMQMFIDWSASGTKSKEGNLLIIQTLKKIEERTAKRAAYVADLASDVNNSPQFIESKLREYELANPIWAPDTQFGNGTRFDDPNRPVITAKTPVANALLGNIMREDARKQQQRQRQQGGDLGQKLRGFFNMFKKEAPQQPAQPAAQQPAKPQGALPVPGLSPPQPSVVPEAKAWAGVSKWLSKEELQSKDGAPLSMSPTFLRKADLMFDLFGSQPPITSAHRSHAHNKKVKGAEHSQHVTGKALDLDMAGMGPAERMKLLQSALQAGLTGIGFYKNSPNMLHIDDGRKRTWGTKPGWAKKIMEASGY